MLTQGINDNPADKELTKKGEGVDQREHPTVKEAVAFIRRAEQNREEKQVICDAIDEAWDAQYSTSKPSTSELRMHEGRLMHDVFWKLYPRTKPLDYTVRNHGVKEPMLLKAVEAAISFELTKGKYAESLREENGVYSDMFKYSDALQKVSPKDGSDATLYWEKLHITKCWIDTSCRDIHTTSGFEEADELAYTFDMSLREAWDDYPESKGKIAPGRVDLGEYTERQKEQEDTEKQEDFDTRKCQIIVYFNKRRGKYIIFGGSSHTVLKEPKSYPFKDLLGNNIIPVSRRKCFPASSGFYSHSVLALFFREHIIEE